MFKLEKLETFDHYIDWKYTNKPQKELVKKSVFCNAAIQEQIPLRLVMSL